MKIEAISPSNLKDVLQILEMTHHYIENSNPDVTAEQHLLFNNMREACSKIQSNLNKTIQFINQKNISEVFPTLYQKDIEITLHVDLVYYHNKSRYVLEKNKKHILRNCECKSSSFWKYPILFTFYLEPNNNGNQYHTHISFDANSFISDLVILN